MVYVLCVLYVALIYVRPGEILPALAGIPILGATGAAAGVAAAVSLLLRPRRFVDLPNDWCFLAFLGASVLSVAANGWLGGAFKEALTLLPLLFFYVLIRVAVETERQLRWLVAVVVALTLFQAANGIIQHQTGVGFGNTTAYVPGERTADPDEPPDGIDDPSRKRVRGTGIFGDPNDLAMCLVIACPFLFGMMLAGDAGILRRLTGAAGLAVVLYALLLTQSRGGLLGLAALGAAYAYRRFGRLPALLVGLVLAVAMLAAGASRLQQISVSEDSAHGRIEAWGAGFQMLRSSPVLGIGAGLFTDHHDLVAHNSIVHTAAEVGLVGTFCLVGMLYWFLAGNGTRRDVSGAAHSRMALDIWASGIGLMVCAFFLSRQYSPVFYVPLVLGAVRMNVERTDDEEPPWRSWWDWPMQGFATVGVLVFIYAIVRVSA